ncbi:MAG: energy-coupling factor transporter ATPase [Acutalibacteraceae bacterium]|nr:energy-coupling factor transporter ATPase [Clostridia bacterium]MEE1128083.1 energy-coupling factor transporter ATPase [Acutalibacteraceae bacterium]MBQ2001260.1 energy-coupling factor transporter ATPase [Clostridia bacterium]MBQ2387306.1 energy-coupling factor transporter ATPase [Clostridia bacterium]MBQ2420702.1 energy-coupling factor transporter ATPase [Clostridia bacterium]
MDNIIELKKVVFDYTDENDLPVSVLDEISLSIERGSFTAVLGHNGSGKSTMAKLLNGLNKPSSGTVTVNGMDTADEKHEFEVRKTVGLVFQNPDNQIVASIVEEDVAFGPENLGVEPKEIRNRVDEALKSVGMYEYRTHAPFKLSGGQKQRIAIAGILAMQPECIVLDEPTAMLDPRGRSEVIETIQRLNREKGMTIVLITHYMDEAALADRVVVMDGGKVILDGTPMEVFGHVTELKSVGLDVPQPTELVTLLKADGVDIDTDVLDVDQCVEALVKALHLEEK